MQVRCKQKCRKRASNIGTAVVLLTPFLLISVSDAFVTTSNGIIHNLSRPVRKVARNDSPLFMKSRSTYTTSTISNYNARKSKNMRYLRIQPRNVRGNRRAFELQTAVTTLSKTSIDGTTSKIDLHSQLHFGDDDYFQFYNEKDFQSKYDNVFYELIVSNDMMQTNANGSQYMAPLQNVQSKNRNPIAPPPMDENTANSYGLECQLNVIDYTKPNWIHCDATREEYQQILSKADPQRSNSNTNAPIWAMSSTAAAPIQGLIRPFTPSTSNSNDISGFASRRLFSNLFLDGDALATFFRILLWSFSPSPEVSILLLDWSSLVDPKPTGMISPIFIPVMEALLTGNLQEGRRLVFAQLLVSGQTSGGRDLLLVRKRNSVAIEKFLKSVDEDCKSSNAILYGAMHCQDLQTRFEKLGYSVTNVEWRTAWSVSVPTFGTGNREQSLASLSPNKDRRSWGSFAFSGDTIDFGIGLVLVPLYLLIGGFDWIGTVKDIAESLDRGALVDSVAIAIFYLARHLAMYLGLSKFVVEWDGEVKLFGGD